MKQIGLYFGSFNPIHNGHVGLAEWMIEQQIFQEVWLVVSPHNPLKEADDLYDDKVRLDLARLSVANNPRIKVSDVEFQLPRPNYTYVTLLKLRELFPEIAFSLIIGADNVALFEKWRNFQEILNNFGVVVYPRKGYHQSDLPFYSQMRWINAPLFNISSTEVRNKLRLGESIHDLVPEPVYRHFVLN